MKKEMKVKFIKKPDNKYDNEIIQIKVKNLDKVKDVANSLWILPSMTNTTFSFALSPNLSYGLLIPINSPFTVM